MKFEFEEKSEKKKRGRLDAGGHRTRGDHRETLYVSLSTFRRRENVEGTDLSRGALFRGVHSSNGKLAGGAVGTIHRDGICRQRRWNGGTLHFVRVAGHCFVDGAFSDNFPDQVVTTISPVEPMYMAGRQTKPGFQARRGL